MFSRVGERTRNFFLLPGVIVVYWMLHNSLNTREGRAMQAMRDHELAATANGIDVRLLRLKAFSLSSAIAAVGGALYAYYLTNVTSEFFGIQFAIQFIAMIIIGGMGSLLGSYFGAAFIVVLPILLNQVPAILGVPISTAMASHLEVMIFGALIIFFLIAEPNGLARLWAIGKEKLRLWPFPH